MVEMRSSVAEIARSRAAALTLSAECIQASAEAAKNAGFPGADAAERLRKEWLNDLVADLADEHYPAARANPEKHFTSWLAERLKNPFHVTYRAVNRVSRAFGDDTALRLIKLTWPREIASAQRFRRDRNTRVAVMSALFLRDAMQDPGTMFWRLAETWVEATSRSPSLATAPGYDLSPAEIRNSAELPCWTPAFLTFADRAYGDAINAMARTRLEALAERARRDEERDLARQRSIEAGSRIRRSPLTRMMGVLVRAVDDGVSANTLFHTEAEFIGKLETGEIILDPGVTLPYREFITFFPANPCYPEPVTTEENLARIARVDLLGKSWIDALPVEYRELGGHRKEMLEAWKADILTERREAPADPITDYGIFLIERSRNPENAR